MESENPEKSVSNFPKKAGNLLRNTLFFVPSIVIVIFIVTVALGEFHGKISEKVSENTAGYNVKYTFDFLPTTISLITDGSFRSIIITLGLFSLLITPLVLTILKYLEKKMMYDSRNREIGLEKKRLRTNQDSDENLEGLDNPEK